MVIAAPAGPAEWAAKPRPDTAPPDALAKPVRAALREGRRRGPRRRGETVLVVWLVPKVAVRATPDQAKNGLTAREIVPGSLVGAVTFPAAFTDYRKQEVPAGVYTLRAATQPETGRPRRHGAAPGVPAADAREGRREGRAGRGGTDPRQAQASPRPAATTRP